MFLKSGLRNCLAVVCTVFLVACGGIDNSASIDEAGEFALSDPIEAVADTPEQAKETLDDRLLATCTTANWTQSDVRELTNVVGLDVASSVIYPGALLQGRAYEQGQFVPVTIPRAPGNIYMTGLTLDPGARYAKNGVTLTGGGVTQAIQELITDSGVQGTAAEASYQEEQTYSYEEMLFTLGVDGRYGSVSMEADLKIETEKSRNFTFVKFTQVFYDIIYEDPELSTSVFRDGAAFEDPEGQIGSGNPPLYVSQVSYGRMVFFVAEATHDASEVETSLGVAVRGGAGEGKVESGLTYRQVLDQAKVYYYVVGGDAGLALKPLSGDGDMFTKVRNFISDRDAANFSASNPGAPISYTLRYLKDRTPARMSYFVTYDKKDCTFEPLELPKVEKPNYYLEVENLEDMEVLVTVNGKQCGQKSKTSRQYDIYRCLRANGSNTVTLHADPQNLLGLSCPKVSIKWYLHKDRSYAPVGMLPMDVSKRADNVISDENRCDKFNWSVTINTSNSTVSNYTFRD